MRLLTTCTSSVLLLAAGCQAGRSMDVLKAVHSHSNPVHDRVEQAIYELNQQRANKKVLDHRYNSVIAAQAETIWAVRVLKNAVRPNWILAESWPAEWDIGDRMPTMMDLMWFWLQLMTNNPWSGPPFVLNPPIVHEGDLRNEKPADLVWAMSTGHDFKNGFIGEDCVFGMDCYINKRLAFDKDTSPVIGAGSKCEQVVMQTRHKMTRDSALFSIRGRENINKTNPLAETVLKRVESTLNSHAGIAPLEYVPEEAKDFFSKPLRHDGKNGNQRQWEGGTDQVFFSSGAPFIAGASGSIEYQIHSMEDTLGGSQPAGLIPCDTDVPHLREALIGLRTAALIATGHHSMAECLAVAQDMGYFSMLPKLIDENSDTFYEDKLKLFEGYFEALGLVGSEGIVGEFAAYGKDFMHE